MRSALQYPGLLSIGVAIELGRCVASQATSAIAQATHRWRKRKKMKKKKNLPFQLTIAHNTKRADSATAATRPGTARAAFAGPDGAEQTREIGKREQRRHHDSLMISRR
jgi:hypothetical protein